MFARKPGVPYRFGSRKRDPNLLELQPNLHRLTRPLQRHRITVGLHRHVAVPRHHPALHSLAPGGGPSLHRHQRLASTETLRGFLVRRPVYPLVRYPHAPIQQVGIELLEVPETLASQAIALDVLDRALHLAFRLRSVVPAQPQLHPIEVHPVLECSIPHHLTRRFLLRGDDRARIVVKNCRCAAPEVSERCGMPVEQSIQTLTAVPLCEQTAAVAQNHRGNVHTHPLLAQIDPCRAPVHLRLLARTRLEAHRGRLRPPPRLPPGGDVLQQRPVRTPVPQPLKLTMQHHGIEAHLRRTDAQKSFPRLQQTTSTRPPLRRPALATPLAHRLDVQPQVAGDRLLRGAPLPKGLHRSTHALADQRFLRRAFRRYGEHPRSQLFFHDFHPFVAGGGKISVQHGGSLGLPVTLRGARSSPGEGTDCPPRARPVLEGRDGYNPLAMPHLILA